MLIADSLLCEYLVDPIGLDERQPRLSWRLRAQHRGARQTAYQIRVATSRSALLDAADVLWDTGKIACEQSLHIPYAGPQVRASQRYFWQVRVWDERDVASEWSAVAFWETGLLDTAAWQAAWISPDWEEDTTRPQPVPLLRRAFRTSGAIASARLYATSLGVYEMRLNGERVGEALLTPGWTSYDHRLQYQTYDVTHLLHEGENVLGVLLGDGWYRGYLGNKGFRNVYGDRLALLAQLQITYADGRVEVLGSDGAWRASTGPILMSDFYEGETYDARLERDGWDAPGYDDADWHGVRQLDLPKEIIVAQVGPLVLRQEVLRPVRILRSPKGETILDFGQNMVGWVRMRVRGPRGTVITLRHAEVLDQQGNLYTENLRAAVQVMRYTLRGLPDADEVCEPHFSFQGFQFVAVEGFPGELSPEQFAGVVIHSDMAATGTFECSNPLINQLQRNIVWGQKGNFVDVPTDCPQRDERLGWSGDTQVFIRTACFNMNVAGFITKWLRDLSADQLPDGSVSFIVPDVMRKFRVLEGSTASASGSAGWGDAAVICPWTMYLCYGDTRLLEEQYASMVGWVNLMRSQAGDDYIWRNGSQFGDWLDYRGPDPRRPAPVTNTELVATAFFAYTTELLSQVALVLGKTDDAACYAALAQRVRVAFNHEFVTPAGRVGPNTQTAYLLALHFDLLPEQLRPIVAERLVNEIRRSNDHLTTGFLGTPYLCHVLSRFGYTDVAYRLLTRETYPSWLYPVTQGATTIWERWDGIKPDGSFQDASMNSFNHYAYGAIGEWLYRVVAGIEVDASAPGYKRILFQPQPGGQLSYVRARMDSMYGRVEAAWRIAGDTFHLAVTVPPNTEGVVRVAACSMEHVSEGGVPLTQAEGVRRIEQQDGFVRITVGAGQYAFAVAQYAGLGDAAT